jgi:hypothetical protein
MDQMSALRQIAVKGSQIVTSKAYLFQPGETFAVRQGSMNGTPMPHEEPQGSNPPAGVVAYYWLKTPASGPIKLEVLDGKGTVRACSASDTPVSPVDTEAINVQAYWLQPAPPPSAAAGMHRFAIGGATGRGAGGGGGGRGGVVPPAPKDACSSGAVAAAAPAQRRGGFGRGGSPGLQPGEYTLRLTVDGQTLTQEIAIKPDPRGAPAAGPESASAADDDDDDH